MIIRPLYLMMSRVEPALDGKEWLCELIAAQVRAAKSAWLYRWPDRMGAWAAWDVVTLVGDVGSWSEAFFLRFDDLGKHPLPRLAERWRYVRSIDQVDPLPHSSFDPPVLHFMTQLYSPSYWPGKMQEVLAKHNAAEFSEVEHRLEQLGVQDNPEGQTRAGVARLLSMQGLELAGPTDPPRGRESGKLGWRVRPRVEVEREVLRGVAALSGI